LHPPHPPKKARGEKKRGEIAAGLSSLNGRRERRLLSQVIGGALSGEWQKAGPKEKKQKKRGKRTVANAMEKKPGL